MGNLVMPKNDLIELAKDADVAKEFKQHCPAGTTSEGDLKEVLNSIQLQQCMATLTQAVYSENLPALFAAMDLAPSKVQGTTDPMLAFVKALEEKYASKGDVEMKD